MMVSYRRELVKRQLPDTASVASAETTSLGERPRASHEPCMWREEASSWRHLDRALDVGHGHAGFGESAASESKLTPPRYLVTVPGQPAMPQPQITLNCGFAKG